MMLSKLPPPKRTAVVMSTIKLPFAVRLLCFLAVMLTGVNASAAEPNWLWSTAYAIPKETTSEGSGYFSIIEGKNSKLYIGTAKYQHNAYLVEFDPQTKGMQTVVDAHREIGTNATGFAAQAKFHTRNNVGQSGRIYLGTKQGYPQKDESRLAYAGGYPIVYDPATGKSKVYPIPVPHHGIISIIPDESRNIAYVSTCDDARPIESTHFMILDLTTGKYRDLLDCQHMYAFIVLDAQQRAYHPILGGEIARYDPATEKLERLPQTIDGQSPAETSLWADPKSHPLNWEVSPDRKTLWAVAMSGNQLVSYDLTTNDKKLVGKSHGPLVAGAKATDCRALCVAANGTVWAGVAVTWEDRGQQLHVVSYQPGTGKTTDHGPIAIKNANYTTFTDDAGKALPWHHGVIKEGDGPLRPRYSIMGICAHSSGTVYVARVQVVIPPTTGFPAYSKLFKNDWKSSSASAASA